MLHSSRLQFWLIFICLWRGHLLSVIPAEGSSALRGLTKRSNPSMIINNLSESQNIAKETRNVSPSATESLVVPEAKSIEDRVQNPYVSDLQSRLLLTNALGNKRKSERIWNQPGTCLRNAFSSLGEKIKAFFRGIKEFLWGSESETDDVAEIRYVPKEEDERREILQNFMGAVSPGIHSPPWFKDLESSFRALPAITEWDRKTQSLLCDLVFALATQTLFIQTRKVILSAINHITSYNPQAKQALIDYANMEPLIFKTLALSIKDVRSNHVPDLKLKHSFEAEWLSTSPEVEEKFFRLVLVDPNSTRLSEQVKRIGERLEHCKDVYTWTEVEKSTGVIKDGEIKIIMNDAMELLKLLSDVEDRLYTYRIILYIAVMNNDAQEAWKKKFLENDFRTSVVKILFILYSNKLMDELPADSLERKILLSDPETGPVLERTALQLYIGYLQPLEHIQALTNKILAPDLYLTGFPPNPKDPKSAQVLLSQLIELVAPKKEGEPTLSAWDKEIAIRLLAYLSRWNKSTTRVIQESLNTKPHFLRFIATEVVKKYPDGAHETSPKFSFERDILKPRYLAELFGRCELKFSTSKMSAPELIKASKSLKLLPKRWYEDPLAPKPQEIVRSLLNFIKELPKKDDDYEAKTAIRMIQHFVYYQPSLKELVLVAIGHSQNTSLHFHLNKYCETAQHYSKKKGGYTSRFVDWLNEIRMLKDSSKNMNDQFPSLSLLQPAYLIGLAKQRLVWGFRKIFQNHFERGFPWPAAYRRKLENQPCW